MRKILVLISLGFTILILLGSTLLAARYVMSPATVLQLGSILNLFGRPIVAVLMVVVLATRFKDVWTGVTSLASVGSSHMAAFAQSLGVVLMAIGLVTLVATLGMHFGAPRTLRSELPLFFIFGPVISFMPFGYLTFEVGLSMARDRE